MVTNACGLWLKVEKGVGSGLEWLIVFDCWLIVGVQMVADGGWLVHGW